MKGLATTIAGVGLRFEQTVPCALTHRRAIGEVFVTDSARLDDDTFLAAIQLPRAHSLWGDREIAYHDPLAVIEAGRQVAFLVIHRYLGVPLGLPFILGQVDFRVLDLRALADNRSAPLEAVMHVSLADRSEKQGLLTRLTFRADVLVGDAVAMELGGEIQFVQRKDYDMIRSFSRARKKLAGRPIPDMPRPIDGTLVGRKNQQNIVIGEAQRVGDEDRYMVLVDHMHPSFFDHSQDHLPGPLILEAYRQAAMVTAQRAKELSTPHVAITSGALTFSEFGEFEAIVECHASMQNEADDASRQVRLALFQCGTEIARAIYGLTACD